MSDEQPPRQRRIDRILAEGYAEGLERRSTDEIRAMRDECEEEETGISYARRVLQGRLDIIRAELLRRDEATAPEAADLLARLPAILADPGHTSDPAKARAPRYLMPPHVEHARRAIDRVADEQAVTRLEERSFTELETMVDDLAALEETLSAQRRLLFQRIDRLQEELIRRYKSGAADVADILSGRS